jgi:hypothetical protein
LVDSQYAGIQGFAQGSHVRRPYGQPQAHIDIATEEAYFPQLIKT